MRVVFLGNHTVGIQALKAIRENAELVGVIAHPEDPEDGVVYESVYDYALENNIKAIRTSPKKQDLLVDFVNECSPDLLWITDYRYILPQSVLSLSKQGAINLHPSLLPKYRGRAPINWAIIAGEKKLGLTAHYIDEGVDTGAIIKQVSFGINDSDYIGDILLKYYPLYFSITKSVINEMKSGKIQATKQIDNGTHPVYKRRTWKDGKINWEKDGKDIYNLIRAVSRPYPGAFAQFENFTVKIWKATYEPTGHDIQPGKIVSLNDSEFKIAAKNGYLNISEFEIDSLQTSNPTIRLKEGYQFV